VNRGKFNGFAINGPAGDQVVRVRVDARGFARIRSGGRVLAYARIQSEPAASFAGHLGRVEAHIRADAMARAAVLGALGHAEVHGLIAARGRAVIKVTLPPVRSAVPAKARANIGLRAHVLARGAASVAARAKLSQSTYLERRGPVRAHPATGITADGTVYARRQVRSPLNAKAQAFIVTRTRTSARLAVLLRASASVTPRGYVAARAPLATQGRAVIEIDPAVFKQLPFDEPAPDSRTFSVPPAMTTFHVTDQGTSMFRASPPQQPADVQDYDIEFAEWFPPGDEVLAVALKVAPAMPMPPSYAINAQRVKVWVYAGGKSGTKYQITVTATTSDGRVKEVELVVPIKEQ